MRGSFVMMDALGFKAVSRRDPDAALAKLHALEATAAQKQAELEEAGDKLERHGWLTSTSFSP